MDQPQLREIGGELKPPISIILLAAGSSSRMGQSKQLLSINNEPLLLRTVKTAIASTVKNVIVILGADEQKHRSVIEHLPVQIIHNPTWSKGMGNSLKAGLNHLLSIQPETQAAIISVCDQPLLTTDHFNQLVLNYHQKQKPIVASLYSGSPGVPALFVKSLFPDLLKISDDQGAKKVINAYSDSITLIDFPGGEIDLDTPEEYKAFGQRSI